ncbi:protein of unknown function [Nitrospira japonica]|uniref:Dystroglycan-type cadherin-like domain-containing protein n=2 Tax=Nitrospira japonica TaxID=1325564 RepID=A0A1W1I9F5_9BACT|nr:protein of unknown function [Nitrospira japonica]
MRSVRANHLKYWPVGAHNLSVHDRAYRISRLGIALAATAAFCSLLGCNDMSKAPPPDPVPGELAIATTFLPDGDVGEPYVAAVGGSGGITPYKWSVSPALPPSLTFDQTSGSISGTPTTAATTTHTFTLQDSSNPADTVQKSLSLTVEPPLLVNTTSLPVGRVNVPYPVTTLTAVGGLPPLVWQPVAMPFGLTFDPASHSILGTPLTSGTTSVTFTVRDSSSPFNKTASATLGLTIAPSLTSR